MQELNDKVNVLSNLAGRCFHSPPPAISPETVSPPPHPHFTPVSETGLSQKLSQCGPVQDPPRNSEYVSRSQPCPLRGNRTGRNRNNNQNVIKSSNVPSNTLFSNMERLNLLDLTKLLLQKLS